MVRKMKIMELFRDYYRNFRRKRFLMKQRQRLINKDICLIASNCNGGTILHDLGLQFKSPFVNLWIKPKDYLKLLKSLPQYMETDIKFISEEGVTYPVGLLDDVKIYFQHYKSEEEAKEKWVERTKRMNYDKLFILFTDRDGCTENDLEDFDHLPYENKAVFVNNPHPNIKSAVYIKGFEKEKSVGMCMNYKNKLSYKKYYDDFDYVAWFNSSLLP